MKRPHIFGELILKLLLDLLHALNQVLGMLAKARCSRSRNQPFSRAHKEFCVQFVRKIVELEADGAG